MCDRAIQSMGRRQVSIARSLVHIHIILPRTAYFQVVRKEGDDVAGTGFWRGYKPIAAACRQWCWNLSANS